VIALGYPWALVGLLSLPVLVWIHRRRRRAVPIDVPSVLFLEAEVAEPVAPERVRLDAELLLALAAAAFLALAATSPRVSSASSGRTVLVVEEDGAWQFASPSGGKRGVLRVDDAWWSIRYALAESDRLVTVHARGGPEALLAAARVGEASLRVIITDRLIRPEPADVRVVAVGPRRPGIWGSWRPTSRRDPMASMRS